MTAKKKEVSSAEPLKIEVPPMEIMNISLRIVGDAPLITHKWSEKAKREILYKQQKKAGRGKDTRYPYAEYCSAIYWLTEDGQLDESLDWSTMTDDEAHYHFEEWVVNHKFGFPTIAFKACAIDAAYQQGIIPVKTTARGALHIQDEFAIIEGTPIMREDSVKIGMGTAGLSYRPEFKEWSTTLNIKFNARAISAEQIVNFFNVGGFANGVGEWRSSRDGRFGTFHIE